MKAMKWLPIACLMSGTVFGAGFQLYTEGSAEALGQAGAISGRTNLVSLAWYNPSALAGTERPAILFGSTFVQINTDFNSPAGDASMSDEWRVVPHLYYVQPISKDWTAMLSVNAPYGLITEWPNDWAGREIATYTELQAIYTTPSVAYRVNDNLSVSVGFNCVWADAELSSVTNVGVEVDNTLAGDDIGYGLTASVHYKVADNWSVGARYQSQVDLEFDGEIELGPPASVTADGEVDISLPAAVNFGVANTSFKNLSLGLDFLWTEWSSYDQITVNTASGTTSVPKLWSDVWSIRVGGEYALGESWALRAGYVWDQSPVPDTTRSPEMPGSDRQMLMAGVGWKWNNVGIDAAYSYLWAEKVGIGTNPLGLAGEFETTTHLISLSASYTF